VGGKRRGSAQRKEKGGQLGLSAGLLQRLLNGMQRAALKDGPYKGKGRELFEFFGHYGELEFGLGKRLDDNGFGAFGGGVA